MYREWQSKRREVDSRVKLGVFARIPCLFKFQSRGDSLIKYIPKFATSGFSFVAFFVRLVCTLVCTLV